MKRGKKRKKEENESAYKFEKNKVSFLFKIGYSGTCHVKVGHTSKTSTDKWDI